MGDDALNLSGSDIDCRWHDNLVIEGGNTAIAVDGEPHKAGPMYIYRNRCYFTQRSNTGSGVHFKRDIVQSCG